MVRAKTVTYGKALGRVGSDTPLQGLESEDSCAGGQPCLHDRHLVNALDTNAWGSVPGGPPLAPGRSNGEVLGLGPAS